MKWKIGASVALLALVVGFGGIRGAAQHGVPKFEPDPFWPRAITMESNKTMFGSVGGVAIDPTNDHVWVLNRLASLANEENYAAQNPPVAECCKPAPHVMEFDPAGNLIQSWGGPGQGYDWPKGEHGIDIDYKGSVWIGGNGDGDGQLLKFTKQGKFLLQIGKPVAPKATVGKGAPNDVTALNGPRASAGVAQDAQTTVWSGVYTAAQAERGQPLYREACSNCHLDTLAGFGGDTMAAALTGARFFVRWRTETVGEMFKVISETMPQDAAGTLSPQAYVDIMSFVFKANGMPAGDTELPPDREKLAQIVITDRPKR